jgi:hypothetical protein
MADYKEMYLTLLDATEKAMGILIEAQQKCEEIYISSERPSSEQQKPEIVKWNFVDETNPEL